MNDIINEETSTFNELKDEGIRKLETVREKTQDLVEGTTEYIRANPWKAVAGAALLGGIFAALSQQKTLKQTNYTGLADKLEDAYSRIPLKKQIQSGVETPEVQDFIKQLKTRLRLD